MSAAPESSTLVVLGAGSWGTALAIQLARLSRPAVLWGRDPAHVAALARQRSNERYLPQAAFPDSLRVEADLAAAVRAAPDVLIAVPSHSLRLLLEEIAPRPRGVARGAPCLTLARAACGCRRSLRIAALTRASVGRPKDSSSRPACCRTKSCVTC